jgi:hypothetical protein
MEGSLCGINRESLLVCFNFSVSTWSECIPNLWIPGIFVDNAMSLIPVPAWSESQVAGFFEATIKEALSFGLTSIHDADTRLEHIEFFKK